MVMMIEKGGRGTDANFGERLRAMRLLRGLTQKQLEAKTGIDKGRISAFENGHINPRLSTVLRFTEALGCSADELA